jgi:hypothetical protein
LHFLYRKEAEDALTQGKINGPLIKDELSLITTGEELGNLLNVIETVVDF